MIFFYIGTSGTLALSKVFSFLGAVILIYAIVTVVLFYEKYLAENANIFGIGKLLLIKVTVGIITIGFIVVSLINSDGGSSQYSDDSAYSKEDKTYRAYAVSVLIIFGVLCIPYYLAFARKIQKPIL